MIDAPQSPLQWLKLAVFVVVCFSSPFAFMAYCLREYQRESGRAFPSPREIWDFFTKDRPERVSGDW